MTKTVFAAAAALLLAAGCGGGGSVPAPTSTTNNTQPVAVNAGVDPNYVNALLASVTICLPGTATCQTIPDVLVDTGSYGLRILSSQLTISPPQVTDPSGNPLAECAQFEDSFNWGPVAVADVQIAGEKASSVPIHLLGAPSGFPAPPSACTAAASGLPEEDTQATLGANGILGIGVFQQDCGQGCSINTAPPPVYFGCPSAGCAAELVPLAAQVQNPVGLFPQDNNGVMIVLPSVPASGAASVSGSLIFGIGTQADNSLLGVTVLATDDYGDIETSFDNNVYAGTMLDTGSNGIFFLDSSTGGPPVCSDNAGFYCPASTTAFTAANGGETGASAAADFSIANADSLLAAANLYAFGNIGGPNSGAFDFGLPFFFGRSIYIALQGAATTAGLGPYYAY